MRLGVDGLDPTKVGDVKVGDSQVGEGAGVSSNGVRISILTPNTAPFKTSCYDDERLRVSERIKG